MRRLLVRAADARVVGEEQVAAAGELRRRAHRELGELVDAARSDRIDVHAGVARAPRMASAIASALLCVVRRVRDPEREPRDVPPPVRQSSSFIAASAASGASGKSPPPPALCCRSCAANSCSTSPVKSNTARHVVVAVVAVDDERPALLGVRDTASSIEPRDRDELGLQVRDLVAHAAGRVDHERDVEQRVRRAVCAPALVRRRVLLVGRRQRAGRVALQQLASAAPRSDRS